jgi:hypothetical protein
MDTYEQLQRRFAHQTIFLREEAEAVGKLTTRLIEESRWDLQSALKRRDPPEEIEVHRGHLRFVETDLTNAVFLECISEIYVALRYTPGLHTALRLITALERRRVLEVNACLTIMTKWLGEKDVATLINTVKARLIDLALIELENDVIQKEGYEAGAAILIRFTKELRKRYGIKPDMPFVY